MMDIHLALSDLAITVSRVVVTSLLSWVCSLAAGLLMYKHKAFRLFFQPISDFMRNISPFVWLPIAVLIFGLGSLPVGIILFIAMFFPGVIMMYESFRSFPRDILEEAITAGAHSFNLIFSIELPVLKNQLVNIYRIQWSVGWTTVIAAEMLGVSSGLGFRLLDFRYLLEYESMFIYIVIIGFIGIVSDLLIRRILPTE